MKIAISTGTFYRVPFRRALELIKSAGFEYVELLQYWKGEDAWEMGQHLKGMKPKDVLAMVRESGLRISSLHDGGGVITEGIGSVVARSTYEYLEYGAADIPCVVFHTPHKRTDDARWWSRFRSVAANDLSALKEQAVICVENMLDFGGYTVPLLDPRDLLEFAADSDIYVNIDTAHYAQCGVDILEAATILRDRTRSVHLSDYADPRAHVFVGEGTLDLKGFMSTLNKPILHAATIECDVEYFEDNETRTIDRLRQAYRFAQTVVS